jgi:signal transduction histidine kinase
MAIAQVQVRIFDSEIDPLEFHRLDSGHFMLSRQVWREGRQSVQGALIDPEKFLRALVERDFRHTALSRMSELDITSWDSSIIRFSASESQRFLAAQEGWRGQVLHRAQLPAPLNDIKLVFRITKLPAGPGAKMVGWLGGILAAVLCGGIWLLYRLGLRQIAATRQQQDFVSAVSHELKTPLTSIRMYGEMLREGWVPEERKGGCYDFICAESERLSRLIENVLQLARMTRGGPSFELKTTTARDLLSGVRPRISAQIERAGFALRVVSDARAAATMIKVDEDSFAQIVINLIDNALKFSAKSADRRIELSCTDGGDQTVLIGVRDFGPGIPQERMTKIFRPFYRGENERVRETVGTGIGLALVRQLVAEMDARVDVINREPGAEFRIWFKSWNATDGQNERQPE